MNDERSRVIAVGLSYPTTRLSILRTDCGSEPTEPGLRLETKFIDSQIEKLTYKSPTFLSHFTDNGLPNGKLYQPLDAQARVSPRIN